MLILWTSFKRLPKELLEMVNTMPVVVKLLVFDGWYLQCVREGIYFIWNAK